MERERGPSAQLKVVILQSQVFTSTQVRRVLIKYQNSMPSGCAICCEILIAILLPPLGVCLRHGCCTVEFLICLLLTCLGYLPGIIYAIYAIIFIDRDDFFDEYRRPLYAPAS